MKNTTQAVLALSILITGSTAFAGVIENEVASIESSTYTKCEYKKTSWGLRLPGVLFYSARFECKGADISFGLNVKAKDVLDQTTNQWNVVIREIETTNYNQN